MKKFFYLVIVLCCIQFCYGQQLPSFHNNIFQPEFFNPGRTGSGVLGFNYRNQWVDLKENSPVSFFVMADLSNLLKLKEKNIGLGLNLLTDQTHIFSNTSGNLIFSYYLLNNDKNTFSIGVNAGFLSSGVDFGNTLVNDPGALASFTGIKDNSTFSGGGGIAYSFNLSKNNYFSLDIALPRIFTPDIEYSEGLLFNFQPYVISRVSYKYSSGAFGIEPILLYRNGLVNSSIKAGKMDFGGKIYFLEELFWVGGNFRTNSKATSINFGLNPDNQRKFSLLAGYELNDVFGNSVEIGLLYKLGESNNLQHKSLNEGRRRAKDLESASSNIANNAKKKLEEINKEVAKISRLSPAQEAIRTKKLQGSIDGLKGQLKSIQFNNEEIQKIIKFLDATLGKRDNLKESSSYKAIEGMEIRTRMKFNQLNSKIEVISDNISQLNGGGHSSSIRNLISQRKTIEIQKYYNDKLNQTLSLPSGIRPVEVETKTNNSINVIFKFSDASENYLLPQGKEMEYLMNIIYREIEGLRKEKINVNFMKFSGDILYSQAQWKIFSGNYNGEFGSSVNISFDKLNKSNMRVSKETQIIQRGNLSLENLVGLKLYGIKEYFKNKLPIIEYKTEISGPNTGQNSPQIYSISINVSK